MWDLRYSQPWQWRALFTGLWHHVVWCVRAVSCLHFQAKEGSTVNQKLTKRPVAFHCSLNLQPPALILRVWPVIINNASRSVKDMKGEKVLVCDRICKCHFSLSEEFIPHKLRGTQSISKHENWNVVSGRSSTVVSE